MRRIRTIHLQIAAVVLTIIMTALTFTQVVARSVHSDASRVNMYIHGFQLDYFQYLAGIVRGQHGLFWYRSLFTIPNPPVIPLYMLYQILGIITAPFAVWTPIVYHVARILLIVFSVWSMYILAATVLRSRRWGTVATILGILITNPPEWLYSPVIASSFNTWWSILTAYERFNSQPHFLAARGLLCIAVSWYLIYRSIKKRRYLIGSTIAITLCVFNIPYTAVPYFAVITVGVLWDSLEAYRNKKSIQHELIPLLTLIAPLLSLGVIQYTTQIPLWITARLWERDFDRGETWTTYHYYISHLTLLLPAYAGFIIWVKKKDIRAYLMMIWVLIPLLFSPFFYTLMMGGLRFDMFIYIIIPLSILSSAAIRNATTSRLWNILTIGYIVPVILYSCMSIGIYATQQWNMIFAENLNTMTYPPKEYFELADWVKAHVPKEHVILASNEIGTLIVSQSPVFAYIGEQTYGSNFALNIDQLQQFYSDKMNPAEALALLKSHDVSYVVDDPKFIWPLKDLTYPFLTKRWQNDQLGIYQVNYGNTKP
jgi:hypothetical protein